MQPARLPRFQRASDTVSLTLTERDSHILRLLHRHRFLRSHHIISLLGDSPQPVLRRLHLLYHHGYLERPRAQLDYYHHGGSRHIVYGLGKKGLALIQQETGVTTSGDSLAENNRSAGRLFLAHALLVSDVMVALELACRTHGQVRLIHEDELEAAGKRKPFRWRVKINGRSKLGVVPDRVFALEYPDANNTTCRSYFFLEADRGTMPVIRRQLFQTSFFRKLLAYEATWNQNLHRTHFGLHRFRVLTVTTSAKRVETIIKACSTLKRGQGLFLFADSTVLERPDSMLSAIWHTAVPGKMDSLLD